AAAFDQFKLVAGSISKLASQVRATPEAQRSDALKQQFANGQAYLESLGQEAGIDPQGTEIIFQSALVGDENQLAQNLAAYEQAKGGPATAGEKAAIFGAEPKLGAGEEAKAKIDALVGMLVETEAALAKTPGDPRLEARRKAVSDTLFDQPNLSESFILPLLLKRAKGTTLTDDEQAAWDMLKNIGIFDQLERSLLGPMIGGGGAAPGTTKALGSQENPHRPQSATEFDAVPEGEWVLNPGETTPRRKATGAAGAIVPITPQ
ncbi:MAG: hypothetical protein ACREIB_07535, partial [Pseudomonadota bacterium]